MKILFVWKGINGRYGQWCDGLYRAMKRIEEEHEVKYSDFPLKLDGFEPDVCLYWEAPMSVMSFPEDFAEIHALKCPKALLFAGGPMEEEWIQGFDHIFVESEMNAKELEEMEISHSTAFGVNEDIFFPLDVPKAYDGFIQATFAGWKRQPLFAQALEGKGVLCGRYQENDKEPWDNSSQSIRLPEMPYEVVNKLINSAHCVVNTAEYWGGGQRCTLEAMCAGVPVIVMSDSPKNIEYVKESGAGIICDPDPVEIKKAIQEIKGWSLPDKIAGREYVFNKWTSKHYADNLLKWCYGITK